MKLSKTLLTVIVTLGFLNIHGQTADEVINKHIEAIGGKEKISQVKTIYMEGDLDIMNNQAPSLTYIVNGKGYKNELDFNGSKIITVYTDKGGWTINPMAGQTTATPVADDVLKFGQLQLDAAGPLVDYSSKGNKVELLGKDGGHHKLKVTTSANIETIFFIDTTTYYIARMQSKMPVNGQEMEVHVENSDFRKTNAGTVMPYSIKLDMAGLTFTTKTKKLEVNKDIDPAIFEMPKN